MATLLKLVSGRPQKLAGDDDFSTTGAVGVGTLAIGGGTALTTVDTDLASVSDNDDSLASAKAIKAYVDSVVAAPTAVTAADTENTSTFVALFEGATGSQAPKTDEELTYNASTGVLTATGFAGPLTGNVTGNASGSSGSCTGNAATATALESARTIGGVSFDGTGNITLPGVNAAGNQDTTGNAATATALATARTIGGVSFDGTENISLISASIPNNAADTTGNAATATALATARNIGGVSFDGTENIDLPGVNTTGNQNTTGNAATVTTNANLTGHITSVGNAASLGSFTKAQLSAAVSDGTPIYSGDTIGAATLASTVTVSDSDTDTAFPVVFNDESNALLDDTGAFTYNPNTGTLVTPNLTVSGTTTTLTSTTLATGDAMISLAIGQTDTDTDAVDIGLYGTYDVGDTQKYRGMFLDLSAGGALTVFKDLEVEPTTTVNTGHSSYALGNIVANTVTATLSGNVTGNVTGNVSGSSGSCTGNAATATALASARTIGGVSFDGSENISLPGVNATGNQDTTGNAATATALATARTINGVSFDGTENITLGTTPISAGGTGSTSASGARTALGLAIGSDVQAFDADLTNLAGCQAGASAAFAALTSGEVGALDLTTGLGTAEASKALTASASNVCNVDAIDVQMAADSTDRGFYDGTNRFSYSAFIKNWAGAKTYTNAEAITADCILAIDTDGKLVKADCSVEAEYDSLVGVAVASESTPDQTGNEVISAYGAIVINGTDGLDLDEGDAVYLSTGGNITKTLPTTTNHAVIKLGVCVVAGGIGTGKYMWCPQFLYVN
tara:strand:+ start:970 stop:3363 length:2394 start_codon:yes stop_codon:yes gene_type:complete